MSTAPVRRMRTDTASARGAKPAPEAHQEATQRRAPVSSRAPTKATTNTEERGHGYVSTSVKDKHSTYYEQHREVEVLQETFSEEDPAAFIRVGAGMTINLDNYESLRIDCAVTIPCKRGSLKEAYDIASDFVADRINEEQVNWLGTAEKVKASSGKGR
jgi:hypothetical protein